MTFQLGLKADIAIVNPTFPAPFQIKVIEPSAAASKKSTQPIGIRKTKPAKIIKIYPVKSTSKVIQKQETSTTSNIHENAEENVISQITPGYQRNTSGKHIIN